MSGPMKQKLALGTKSLELHALHGTPPWEWPKNAGETFKAVLTDKEATAADRLVAAELAGEWVVVNDDLAFLLVKTVSDASESPELRATAATALGPALEGADLGDYDDPVDAPPISEDMFHRIQRALHELYESESVPKEVRRHVLEAAVRAQDGWHANAIKEAYSSEDRDWMLTAVFCMRYVAGFEKEILQSLESSDEQIHVQAILAAGNQEVDEAWRHIYDMVENAAITPKPLLLAAIESVAKIRQDADSLEILNHLIDSDDEEISEAADEALSMAGAYTEFDEDAIFEEEEEDDASGWIN